MGQDLIWGYYQNESPGVFLGSGARLDYLARQLRPDEKVLNIGVGSGIFEEIALKRKIDIYSLDPNPETISRLEDRPGMKGKAKVGFGQEIPFPEGFFDAVVLSEVLEHLTEEEVDETLKEIDRVLVPSGRLIGTVPAHENLTEQMVVCPRCGERFHRWGHVQSFSPARVHALLSSHFQEVKVSERPFIGWKGLNWKGKVQESIRLFLYRLGVHGTRENILFSASKTCA